MYPLDKRFIRLLALLAALILANGCSQERRNERYSVAILGGGDTLLDDAFLQELTQTFEESSQFSVVATPVDADLVVTLQRNVRPLEQGENGMVGYEVTLGAKLKAELQVLGECRKQELVACAQEIFQQSKDFVRGSAR